ncbi:MAG: nucleoside hydrolase [Ilumatobacteraceae bacterium]
MSLPPNIILDCDPGHDDAFALIVAAKFCNVLGVTTVAGNAPLELTTRNARIILDLCGSTAPLHSGADKPLVQPPVFADYVHGKSGMDGAELPEPSRPADSTHAIDFIIDTVRSRDDVWLVPTGPLTNVALALTRAPDLAARLRGISLMGGGRFGNRTPSAEFNIWLDPEAAATVFMSGAPIVMAGLHLTHEFQASPSRIAAVESAHPRVGPLLAGLLRFFSGTYVNRHVGFEGAAMHDVCSVLALTHPDLFESSSKYVAVDLHGNHTRGMTVIDDRQLIDRPSANATVLEAIDADRGFSVIVEAVRACP